MGQQQNNGEFAPYCRYDEEGQARSIEYLHEISSSLRVLADAATSEKKTLFGIVADRSGGVPLRTHIFSMFAMAALFLGVEIVRHFLGIPK